MLLCMLFATSKNKNEIVGTATKAIMKVVKGEAVRFIPVICSIDVVEVNKE